MLRVCLSDTIGVALALCQSNTRLKTQKKQAQQHGKIVVKKPKKTDFGLLACRFFDCFSYLKLDFFFLVFCCAMRLALAEVQYRYCNQELSHIIGNVVDAYHQATFGI